MNGIRRVSLELTYSCQEACPWCHNPPTARARETALGRFTQKHGELSSSEWLPVLDKIDGLKPEIIILTGGEPLLVPEVFSLISRIRDLQIVPALVTNGELLEKYASALIEAGLRLIWVTVLGSSAATNDVINGRPGSFDKKLRGLRSLRNAFLEDVILPMVNVVVEPRNVAEVYGIIQMLRDERIPIIHVERVFRLGHAAVRPRFFLNEAQHKEAVNAIQQARKDFPNIIINSQTLCPDRDANDTRPKPNDDFINIRPDGMITPIESGKSEIGLNIQSCNLNDLTNPASWLQTCSLT